MQESSAFFRNVAAVEKLPAVRVLCLDEDEHSRDMMRTLLASNGYQVECASTLGEALELAVRNPPHVIFTEILFNEYEGVEVLRALKKIHRSAVLIIYTVQEDRRVGRNRRLNHIFEFIVKPSRPSEIIGHLKRAVNFYRDRQSLRSYLEESRNLVHQQLEWLIWTEKNRIEEKIHHSKAIVDSIKHSITQGNGIGSLITYIEMLNFSKKEHESGKYLVDRTMVEELSNASVAVRGWLDDMDSLSRLLARRYEPQLLMAERLRFTIRKVIDHMERFRSIKNHTVEMQAFDVLQPVQANTEVVELALRELLTNAFKFSTDESKVRISFHRAGNALSILVTNQILRMEGGVQGIPQQLESRLFEPFFRLNNINDDRYHDEVFGMGTGLTIVQGAVNQVGGKIYLYESNEPTGEGGEVEKLVVAELIFPVVQEQSSSL